MTTVGVAHRYFLYLSPIIVQASPSYNLLKPLSLSPEGENSRSLAWQLLWNKTWRECKPNYRRQRDFRSIRNSVDSPLPDVIMSRDQTSYRSDIPAEARSPIYKFRFINRGGWVYRGCDA